MTILILSRSRKSQWRCPTSTAGNGGRRRAPNMGPSTVSFAEQLLCKLGVAFLFAIMLAIVTNASLVQGLRFILAICLLTSSWHFGVALVRRRPLSGPSEWGEAVIFSLI